MKEDLLELLIGVVVFAIIIIANVVNLTKRRGKGFNLKSLFAIDGTASDSEDDEVVAASGKGSQAGLSEEARQFFRQYRQENTEQFFGSDEFDEAEDAEPEFGYTDSSRAASPEPAAARSHSRESKPFPDSAAGNYVEHLRRNPRYAIVMHEILGQPRSEAWK